MNQQDNAKNIRQKEAENMKHKHPADFMPNYFSEVAKLDLYTGGMQQIEFDALVAKFRLDVEK